jgi:hypothetical protein
VHSLLYLKGKVHFGGTDGEDDIKMDLVEIYGERVNCSAG